MKKAVLCLPVLLCSFPNTNNILRLVYVYDIVLLLLNDDDDYYWYSYSYYSLF